MSEQDINSNLVINENGILMIKSENSIDSKFKEVVGIRPASKTPFHTFLSQLSDKNYQDAFEFTFKY